MKNWKLPVIISGVILTFIVLVVFMLNSVPNKVIALEENLTTAASDINAQEKRRYDLIPNLVDCVKEYDEHEYQTLMAVVTSENANHDEVSNTVQTSVNMIARAYPELKSSEQYKKLMDELTMTENLIVQARTAYNETVTKYNTYCRKFPNKQILNMMGYEVVYYEKINFNVSSDAPTNLFD